MVHSYQSSGIWHHVNWYKVNMSEKFAAPIFNIIKESG
jgi:hypothetical protein